MANIIKIKRSTGSTAPTTGQLTLGEIGYAEGSNILYYNRQNSIVKIGGAGMTLNDFATPASALSLGSQRITNLAAPVSDTDAANKAYVDAARVGLDVKQSVRVATTVGASLGLTGAATVDGVTLVTGDRILVKDQSTASQNGIYIVDTAGAWSRSTDADADAEVTSGLFLFVEEGTVNSDSGWVLTTNGAITVGSTALNFAQFSGAGSITAGAGLTKTGNTIDIATTADEANGRLYVAADTVSLYALGTGGTGVTKVDYDDYGRITGSSNPTTLSGYGITDAQPLASNLTDLSNLSYPLTANILIGTDDMGVMSQLAYLEYGLGLVSQNSAYDTRFYLGLGGLAVLGAAPAGTLTGTTLASNVVTSSLTSVGTLGTLTVSGLTSLGTVECNTLTALTGVTVDTGEGNSTAVLTLVGRNSGNANPVTLTASTTGILTISGTTILGILDGTTIDGGSW